MFARLLLGLAVLIAVVAFGAFIAKVFFNAF